ncbi:RdgB/HAM1 family non-canonical purine NTP pyrophosphatase [Massiliimalia massiliensis]|uniref:RdgB/HAM1 family non-canonical purine NTP pyrophosphatase n=1 Tax=Massiliimalia massiliensis TaxID=1852384 RepID=UPI000985B7DA|nr:RdgB/HAM1 family non-canonical purine NTP pyrophosphatase [Massiliimalia massiliensis]
MIKLVAATQNAHKLVEFRRILEPLGYRVLSQAEADVDIDVEETGTTFAENASLKAEAIFRAAGLPTIADDSGLEVDYLGGEPGIYSARFGGPGLTDRDKCTLILQRLRDVPKDKRTARFVSAIHLILSETDRRTYIGTCEGFIGWEMLGDNGFGYDPIFMVSDTDSFAALSGEEKDQLSHRGAALRKMEEDLKGI